LACVRKSRLSGRTGSRQDLDGARIGTVHLLDSGTRCPSDAPPGNHSFYFIRKQHADPERHLVVKDRRVAIRAGTKSSGREVSDAEHLAPPTDRPSRDAEVPGDVLLKNTASLHLAKQLTIRAPIGPTRDAIPTTPPVDRAATGADLAGDERNGIVGEQIDECVPIHESRVWECDPGIYLKRPPR
jgi:hypothetical protein